MVQYHDYENERPSKRRRSISIDSQSDRRYKHSDRRSDDSSREIETREDGRYAKSRDRHRGEEHENRRRRSHSPTGENERHRRRDRPEYKSDRIQSSRSKRSRSRDRSGSRSRKTDARRNSGNRDEVHRRRSRHSELPRPYQRSKGPLPSQKDAFKSDPDSANTLDKPIEKQKPNFGLTGKLAAASNTVQTANQTIILKYHEPPEARKPSARDPWRLYVFKGEEIIDTVELSEQSCWLFGRETAIADFPIENPSCSKQHAVIQFRFIDKRNEFGDRIGRVKPYIIDLESANGTSVNDDQIPAAKYVELRDKDVIKFGHSDREYIIQLPPKAS